MSIKDHTITGHLTFPADGVRDLLGWARALGRCLELVKGDGIFLSCGERCAGVYAEGCDPARDAYWREVTEILWGGNEGSVPVDPSCLPLGFTRRPNG